MESTDGATKVSATVQFVAATTAFFTGFFALLETLPTPPLFDLQLISNTRPTLAEVGIAFGVVGLLLTLLTSRVRGRWQWLLIASIILAAVGFSGGLFVVRMTF